MEGLAHFQRLVARHAPDARLLEGAGWVGSVVPGCPDVSLVNAVIASPGSDVGPALPSLADEFGPGCKWGVWCRGDDGATRAALEAFGLVLDSSPVAQAAALDEITGLDADHGARRIDAATLVEVNEAAWEVEPGHFARALASLPGGEVLMYGVGDGGGGVASVVAVIPHEGDAHVTLVGTRPEARGRGFASRALRAGLRAARDEHGCQVTTLEASSKGAGVYRAMGYRDLGPVTLYERRP